VGLEYSNHKEIELVAHSVFCGWVYWSWEVSALGQHIFPICTNSDYS
jgi:hypothetical protein